MDKLDAMQTFVRVIEKGSFSSVAKDRGIGQPAVSKQISALEDELGTELIYRTSRSITLTKEVATFTSLHCTSSTTSKMRLHESVAAKLHRRASFELPFLPRLLGFTWCQSYLLFLLPTPTWQLSWRRPKARPRSSKKAWIWRSTPGIYQTPLWLREDSRRR